jgi:hypothetical protein
MELMGGTMSNFLEYARSRFFTDFDPVIITSLSV